MYQEELALAIICAGGLLGALVLMLEYVSWSVRD